MMLSVLSHERATMGDGVNQLMMATTFRQRRGELDVQRGITKPVVWTTSTELHEKQCNRQRRSLRPARGKLIIR